MAESCAPIPPIRIKQICGDACNSALGDSPTYTHSMTETWNTNIINGILRALISESTPASTTACPYKYAVNSTIIQHVGGARSVSGGDDDSASVTSQARRGMHSACGGYWNTEKDGMWAYKHTLKDMDVVVSIIWIGI
ncbi:hypothetical protein TWF506_003887 [Arthrobotrys conoides]|uniref:Dynein light chain n=1 Tax=Arthrobotrys conoides TaxID=74498 RepID=A0AAN8N2X7_9PEZI